MTPRDDHSLAFHALEGQPFALFNERGVEYVGVREIARSLGISPGNLSYHFPRKDDLVEALIGRMRAASERLLDPLEDGGFGMSAYVDLMVAHRRVQWAYRFVFLSVVHLMSRYAAVAQGRARPRRGAPGRAGPVLDPGPPADPSPVGRRTGDPPRPRPDGRAGPSAGFGEGAGRPRYPHRTSAESMKIGSPAGSPAARSRRSAAATPSSPRSTLKSLTYSSMCRRMTSVSMACAWART